MAAERLDVEIGANSSFSLELATVRAFDTRMAELNATLVALNLERVWLEQNNLVALATWKDGTGCYPEKDFADIVNRAQEVVAELTALRLEAHRRLDQLQRQHATPEALADDVARYEAELEQPDKEA